jgi:hypothetical protein
VQCCVNVTTDKVGTTGYCTWDELRELQHSYGWEIANHGVTGDFFDTLTEDEIVTEVFDAHKTLLSEGLRPTFMVYSGGQEGGETGKAIANEIYPFAFRAGGGPIADTEYRPLDLPRYSTDNGNTTAEVETQIDDSVTNTDGLVLYGHKIIEGTAGDGDSLTTPDEKIKDIISYAKNNGQTWSLTESLMRRCGTPWKIGQQADSGYIAQMPDGTIRWIQQTDAPIDLRLGGTTGGEGLNVKQADNTSLFVIRQDGDADYNLVSGASFQIYGSGGGKVLNVTDFGVDVNQGGPADAGRVRFSNTEVYEDSNGEIVVKDSAGNTTTIS